jgi:hypothetical protein
MSYVHGVRNITCALFVCVMIAAWPKLATADPEGWECVDQLPYAGFWVHDHEFPAEACADMSDLCESWCDFCWGTECQYWNYCYEGYGAAGACYYYG